MPRNFNEIIQWLSNDHERSSPDQDYFGHDAVAQRLVGRLVKSQNEDMPTIAVVGDHGSGKTTVLRLAHHHLAAHGNIVLVPVSVWPFESAEAAANGIIDAIVQRLAKEVNVLAVAGVSARYASAIESASTRFAGLASLIRTQLSPQQILDKLADILQAIDLRFVLWIEDLDRFAGAQSHASSRESTVDEKIEPIRALLYLLDRCTNISVIVSDVSLHTRFDIYKIARYVETPPRLDFDAARAILGQFRDGCLQDRPRSFVDPADEKRRKLLDRFGDKKDQLAEALLDLADPISLPRAMTHLLNTPRKVKASLRATWDAWHVLCGEVDFDDVLIMSTVRTTYPDVFAQIVQSAEVLRRGSDSSGRLESEASPDSAKALKYILETVNRSTDKHALEVLIRHVFPGIPSGSDKTGIPELESEGWCPQGLSQNSHVDYWQRYLSLEDVPDARSDQKALEAIASWQRRENADLLARIITDPHKGRQVEHFSRRFASEEALRLLTECSTRWAEQSAQFWDDDRRWPPGFFTVGRIIKDRCWDRAHVAQVLQDLTNQLIPEHLPLVYALVFGLGMPTSDWFGENLIDQPATSELLREVRAKLCDAYGSGRARQFAEAMRVGRSDIVFFLCCGATGGGCTPRSGPFEGWTTFSPVLLELAEAPEEQHRLLGLQILSPFLTQFDDRRFVAQGSERAPDKQPKVRIREGVPERLFDVDRLKQVFRASEVEHLAQQLEAKDEHMASRLWALHAWASDVRQEQETLNSSTANT